MWVLLEVGGYEGADVSSAPTVALGVAAINQAIKEGKASQTLRVLCNPDVALHGVVDACADAYQEQLAALMATKRPAGKTLGAAEPPPPWEPGMHPWPGCSGGAALSSSSHPSRHAGNVKPSWIRHRLLDGAEYYLNLQTLEGSWQRPLNGSFNTTHLSREELQVWAAWGWVGTSGITGVELMPHVLAVGHHPRDSSARAGAPVGSQRVLGGEAAGAAPGLPRSPAVCGTAAHPAGAEASCGQDPGDTARICPSSEHGDTNQGQLLAAPSSRSREHQNFLPCGFSEVLQRVGLVSLTVAALGAGFLFPHAVLFSYVLPEKPTESQ